MTTVLWLQTGACSGDSMSILGAETPDLLETLSTYGVDLLWHPSLSSESPAQLCQMIEDICAEKRELTILCVEGAIATGPDGTGMFDSLHGEPKMNVVRRLADAARFVVAMGTCAAFGGVVTLDPNPTDSTGLQYLKANKGGLLGADWTSKGGLPVVNVAGCPAHPSWMVETLLTLALSGTIGLDGLNRPSEHYDRVVHQGCTRNEFHEYNIEEASFGGEGCLFFNLGCQGPFTQARCNDSLWGGVNSKPRAGAPCVGCTSPDFPKDQSLLATARIGEIPLKLPHGVDRARYMAYKGLAKSAGPERLTSKVDNRSSRLKVVDGSVAEG